MKIDSGCSIDDLAYIVCTALHDRGITGVLSGGGAAAIYAPKAKTTDDLDFILQLHALDRNPDASAVFDLGFERTKRAGIYRHPKVPYTLEFPIGPLSVGDELIVKWHTSHKGDLLLHIISPTDSVRDRLAAAIHWNDFNSILQAVDVARLHDVDLDVIEDWSSREGGATQFDAFFKQLANSLL